MLSLYVIPACIGVGVGILSGLLGVGGGTVLVPLFRLVFDMSAIAATATSLFTIVPTSISGVVTHIRHKTCIPALGIATGLGGALTSPIGVWLAQLSPSWMIMSAAALIIGWSAYKMLSKAMKMKPEPQKEKNVATCAQNACEGQGEFVSSQPSGEAAHLSRRQLMHGVLIGLTAGIASGYVGVGGGFLMVPLFLSVIGISMRLASGTSLIAVIILSIPSVIEQGLLGNINYSAGIAISLGSIPGAFLGARLVNFVPERTIRFIFGAFLMVGAVLLVVNEFGLLG